MKRLLLGFALLSLSAGCFASAPYAFEGQYHCKGKELGSNEPYSCVEKISKTGATYQVEVNCGADTYKGTGIYDAKSHSLAIGFINPAKAEESGVAVSRMTHPQKLKSTWTYLNKDAFAHCECEKVKV